MANETAHPAVCKYASAAILRVSAALPPTIYLRYSEPLFDFWLPRFWLYYSLSASNAINLY